LFQQGQYRVCMASRFCPCGARFTTVRSNQSLQPTAPWRCASMSILISVFSTVAQPRSRRWLSSVSLDI
jgi:hypothetical protein